MNKRISTKLGDSRLRTTLEQFEDQSKVVEDSSSSSSGSVSSFASSLAYDAVVELAHLSEIIFPPSDSEDNDYFEEDGNKNDDIDSKEVSMGQNGNGWRGTSRVFGHLINSFASPELKADLKMHKDLLENFAILEPNIKSTQKGHNAV